MNIREELHEILCADMASQATGCPDAGGYRQWAKEQGYDIVRTLCNSSSAGDWEFLVSKDGGEEKEWFIMWQENNYPQPGFTRHIKTEQSYYGTFEEVAQAMYDLYYQV